MTEPHFHRVAVIGLGLVGSSFMRALRAQDLADEIVGCDSSEAVCATVLDLGIADRVETDPAIAVQGADLVVLATPVGAFEAVARQMGSAIADGAIVTDVGSVKQSVVAAVGPHLPPGAHLVPGHPVAGTEHSGPEAGFADLFRGRWCILTPAAGTDGDAVARLSALWERMGSDVELMDATHHDKVLAITSHLPHLIAYTIVATASDLEGQLRQEGRDSDRVTTA
ncbi:MAG: prephenate dehydrogenase/arogenate dehydrogenase family protein, partial [Alphaproteobacteria bacterium]